MVVVLSIVSAGFRVAVTVTVSVGEVVVPSLALAMFVTVPASMSACVTVYVAVHVIDCVGARPPAGSAGQVTVAIRSSLTVMAAVIVVLPLLVTR